MTHAISHRESLTHQPVHGHGLAAEHGARPRLRHTARQETVRAAVRVVYLLVDPWGPSRFRRWLHVAGARLVAAHSVGPVALSEPRGRRPPLSDRRPAGVGGG